jgi:Pentapeptide repeats (8 copies)
MANSTPHKDRDKQTEPARLAGVREHEKFWCRIKAASDWTKARSNKLADEAEWAIGRRAIRLLVIFAAAGLYLLFGLLLWALLDWYIDPQNASQKKDLVQALALIMAGVAGAISIYFTWRSQRLTREGQKNAQENTQEQLRLIEQGQITERFTRAVDQLGARDENGNPLLEIRLGGIYALERIAKESPERAYHGTVMEVLTAYVRTNAPWHPEQSSTRTPALPEATKAHNGAEQSALQLPPTPPADIRAILNVLRRREEGRVPEKHRVHLDLQRTYLHQADLFKLNLSESQLFEANLSGAFLLQADLSGANLQRADLSEANLSEANLSEANLFRANLQRAYLSKAKLSGAQLYGANLKWANLSGADLSKARGLTPFEINRTIGNDKTTKLPEGASTPDLWSKSANEQLKLLGGDE